MAKRWMRAGEVGIAFLLALVFLTIASSALAADSVYWGTESQSTISFAHLDGSGGGDLSIPGATVSEIVGVAIDAAAGKVYWANHSATKISWANLDGSGGGDLNTGAATVNEPFGVAVDPAAGRIYWANMGNNTISYANLNGSGGGNLAITGATVSEPAGVAVDPAAGRIYWANYSFSGGTISYANLNGSGGADLSTAGATVEGPEGVAIEPVAGRIYWANYHGAAISYANLNGTGAGDLFTGSATVESPSGVAIDPVTERIYWANSTNPGGGISYAKLNGSGGGGDLPTTGASVLDPAFPALLRAPSGTGAPTIAPATSAGLVAGSMQTCSEGSWAPDAPSEFFSRSPQSYSFSWQRDGAEIAGASAETYTPTQAGLYTCRVTAANQAGSSTQTSAAVQVAPRPARVKITKVKLNRRRGTATIFVRVSSAGSLRLTGRGLVKRTRSSGGAGTVRLAVKTRGKARKRLLRRGKARVRAKVVFTSQEGTTASTTKAIVLRKKRKKRR
jgi:DNA-binding beta-propeller fold protein YncE